MLQWILYQIIHNTGPFLITVGVLGLGIMIIFKRFGILDQMQNKVNEIGGFTKFTMKPIKFAYCMLGDQSFRLTIAMQIRNIGFNKSNLNNWNFYFTTANNKRFKGEPVYSTDTNIPIIMSDKKSYPFPILYIESTKLLDQGESIIGAIQFNINGISLEEIDNKKCIIQLEAKDNKDSTKKFKETLKIFFERDNELIAELHDVVKNANDYITK